MPINLRNYVAAAIAAPPRVMMHPSETSAEQHETWVEKLFAIAATGVGVLVVGVLAVLLGLN
jgi:hypothetical protein